MHMGKIAEMYPRMNQNLKDITENQRWFISNILRRNPEKFKVVKSNEITVEFIDLETCGIYPIFREDYKQYNLD